MSVSIVCKRSVCGMTAAIGLLAFAGWLNAEYGTDIVEFWWFWPAALAVFCFFIGLLAVFAGIGGGVLFVPLAGALFPFHLDVIRATGLLIALAGALAASPTLLRGGLADLRLGMPAALAASIFSIFGACLGLALPLAVVQLCLGLLILGVAWLLWRSRSTSCPPVGKQDVLGHALGMHGVFTDASNASSLAWQSQRTATGLLFFCGIGVIAGMFGLGAGWANVPVFNLIMAIPFKVAVGTSTFVLSLADTSAVWVYIHRGCAVPLVAIPAILCLMAGALTGVKLMVKTQPVRIRQIVIAMLLLAGLRSFSTGIAGYW